MAALRWLFQHAIRHIAGRNETGNLTVRPWSIVTKILYDKDTKKATGVEILDGETMKTYEYKAKNHIPECVCP